MTDIFTREKRSWIMSRIRSKKTRAEDILARELRKSKIKFRRYPKIFGNPDFLVLGKKAVVFVDGCFWHKCPRCYKEPKTNKEYWLLKISRNIIRDKKVSKILNRRYLVVRFWEHEIKRNAEKCINQLKIQL